ncbi:hypothetical protein AURDEDRAFT_126404 [Auricularia subglabra TFB-10046 SS5]|nr:hypothetical protein AURDEDRAFT_126404 [Auricularia subglabra TFB-10046 SS5]
MRNLVRLDDLSPVIRYQPDAWHTGQASKDPQGSLYSDGGTFMTTHTSGASASIAWNGTGITVYGAKRPNHGDYTVSLDGAKPRKFSGRTKPGQFGVPLFKESDLVNGPHTIAITDASSSYLDIDWVEIDTEVGETATRLEDGDATSFKYSPQPAWQTTSSHFTSFSGKSGHSSVEITFHGDAIDVFGLVCPECGSFSVRVDGAAIEGTFSTQSAAWTKPQTMLYFARNLGEGTHRVELTSEDSGMLAIDYAVTHSQVPSGTGPGDNGAGRILNRATEYHRTDLEESQPA